MLFKKNVQKFNVLATVDVEEYFHVFFGEASYFPETWDEMDPEFHNMLPALYEIIAITEGKCVLFVVGWLAEKYPRLNSDRSKTGAEIGSHGYLHNPTNRMTLDEFSEDLVKSKRVIESATGKTVRAFRAPGFSIESNQLEHLSSVFEAGYTVDSSIIGDNKYSSTLMKQGKEITQPGLRVPLKHLPTGGGAIFRILPLFVFKSLHKQSKKTTRPLNFYIHSWELYPSKKVKMSLVSSFLQYHNSGKTLKKVRKFFSQCNFLTIDEYIVLNRNQELSL